MRLQATEKRPILRAPIKVSTIGDTGAGKTTLLKRYTNEHARHVDSGGPTMGIDLSIKHVHNRLIELWDTSGSEQYYTFATSYVRAAHAVCLCYDASRDEHDALQSVQEWYARAQECRDDFSSIPVCIVGNKMDLMPSPQDGRVLATESWCASHNIPHHYTSALLNINCTNPLNTIIRQAIVNLNQNTDKRPTTAQPMALSPTTYSIGSPLSARRWLARCLWCC